MRRIGRTATASMRRSIPMVLAMAIGSLMLVDFFFDEAHINALGGFFVESAVLVVAFALLLGLVNVLTVHARRMLKREEGWYYSIGLVAMAVVMMVVLAGGSQRVCRAEEPDEANRAGPSLVRPVPRVVPHQPRLGFYGHLEPGWGMRVIPLGKVKG